MSERAMDVVERYAAYQAGVHAFLEGAIAEIHTRVEDVPAWVPLWTAMGLSERQARALWYALREARARRAATEEAVCRFSRMPN
jgi:hypothetical protein